jgi:hypothetical protein
MSTLEVKELSHPAGEVIKIASGKTLDLKTQGSVTMPTGSVLQVVVGEDSSSLTMATTTYTDTGLSATITPTSTSSKILCMWGLQGEFNAADVGVGTQLVRGSTNIYTSGTLYDIYSVAAGYRFRAEWKHLDSPSSTSSLVYKVQAATYSSRSVVFTQNNNKNQLVLMEIQG